MGIDAKTLSLASEAVRSFRMIDPDTLSAGREAARELADLDRRRAASIAETLSRVNATRLVTPSVMQAATTALESSRLVDTSALSKALAEINKANALRISDAVTEINRANTLRISEAMRALSEANAFRIAEALKGVDLGPSFRTGITEALRKLDFSTTFQTQVAEALAQARGPIAADLAPRFEQAAGEAVVLAESPAVRKRVHDSLVDLDGLSRAERRALAKEIVDAIAWLVLIAAILKGDARVELSAAILGLAALCVWIYWRLTGTLDE